jgi:hypothetical protein
MTSSVSKEQYLKQFRKELHKPIKRNFPKRRVQVPEKDHTWAMDLVDMSNFARQNKGYKWLLTVMDVWTRYGWSIPIKTKKAVDVLAPFKSIINESGRQPKRIWVDEGKEFYNSALSAYLKELGINRYSTYGKEKSVMIERFNRTLKQRMWEEFTEYQTRNWIDRHEQLLEWYNFKPHRGIDNRSPYSMSRWPENVTLCVDKKPDSFLQPKLKIGDVVRVSRQKGIFEKGYTANWSQEQFTIVMIRVSLCDDPPVYYVQDWYHRPVRRGLYEQEVQLVKYPWVYLVEKVIKRDPSKKRMLVKWVGLDSTNNEWIPIDNVVEVIKK